MSVKVIDHSIKVLHGEILWLDNIHSRPLAYDRYPVDDPTYSVSGIVAPRNFVSISGPCFVVADPNLKRTIFRLPGDLCEGPTFTMTITGYLKSEEGIILYLST